MKDSKMKKVLVSCLAAAIHYQGPGLVTSNLKKSKLPKKDNSRFLDAKLPKYKHKRNKKTGY